MNTQIKDELKKLNREIGRRLAQERVRLGISQEKLAAILGVTFQQIQKYENGKNRISSASLVYVARILKLPLDIFSCDDYEIENISRKAHQTSRLYDKAPREVQDGIGAILSMYQCD